jgi:hypothetical protein
MPRSTEPQAHHRDLDVAHLTGLPPATHEATTSGPTTREDSAPEPPADTVPPPSTSPTRRLTVDITEDTRRRFASAAALAGTNMKSALRTFAEACARGDERGLSLLQNPESLAEGSRRS